MLVLSYFFFFFGFLGDAAAIIAADEESFNRQHELELPVCDSCLSSCGCSIYTLELFYTF